MKIEQERSQLSCHFFKILQIVKGTIDGAFRVGCKKRGKWPQAKGKQACVLFLFRIFNTEY